MAQAGRFRPIFSILEISVVGFTPKSSAAPLTPLIFQPVFRRTTKRFSRSRRCISGSVRYSHWAFSAFCGAKVIGSSDEPVTGRSNSRVPDRAKITARSMTFRRNSTFVKERLRRRTLDAKRINALNLAEDYYL